MLEVKIRDVVFSSPVIAASGTFGYGNEVQNFVELDKIGCIITKSITIEPRVGNLSPRIHESKSGMINAIGLANVGVDDFCDKKLPELSKINTSFMISVAGSKLSDYIDVIKQIESSNGAHVGYEINISCPNVKEGGAEFGVDKDVTYKLTSKIRELTDKLLVVKLSPNVTCIEEIALAAESAKADAISAVNTFLGISINYKTGKILLSNKFGGVSGPAIKPLALAKIHKIYNNIKIPVIGMGGISCYKDIVEFMRLGSTMVQVGTLNYRDPNLISNFYDQLKNFLKNNNINSISDLVGKYYEN